MVPESRSALRSVLTTLLSENPSPIGVCAIDDETAFAILAALADLNVPVPERVAVIGSGDIPLAPLSVPALTTIQRCPKSLSHSLALPFLCREIAAVLKPAMTVLVGPGDLR